MLTYYYCENKYKMYKVSDQTSNFLKVFEIQSAATVISDKEKFQD